MSHLDSTGGRDALASHAELENKDANGKDKKTFGRTPDGTGMTSFLLLVLSPLDATSSVSLFPGLPRKLPFAMMPLCPPCGASPLIRSIAF